MILKQDKAIKRFAVRDMVDASSKRDIKEKLVHENLVIPKLFVKLHYCVSCAIHARIVRVRSTLDRKIRVHERKVISPLIQQRAARPQVQAPAAEAK